LSGMSARSFKTSIRVTWADTDAAQVVHYANYFRFFERAEEEFYRSLDFSFKDFRSRGLWFPRVEAFCQYKKPAAFNDLLEVEVTVDELREKSVKLGFTVSKKDTGDSLASGYLIIVSADRQKERATGIPPEISERLRPFAKQVL
jgi:acyl-CoA thioester hydrolase